KHRIRRRSSTSSTPLAKSLQLPPSTQKPTHKASNRTPQPNRRTKRRLGQSTRRQTTATHLLGTTNRPKPTRSRRRNTRILDRTTRRTLPTIHQQQRTTRRLTSNGRTQPLGMGLLPNRRHPHQPHPSGRKQRTTTRRNQLGPTRPRRRIHHRHQKTRS